MKKHLLCAVFAFLIPCLLLQAVDSLYAGSAAAENEYAGDSEYAILKANIKAAMDKGDTIPDAVVKLVSAAPFDNKRVAKIVVAAIVLGGDPEAVVKAAILAGGDKGAACAAAPGFSCSQIEEWILAVTGIALGDPAV